MIAMSMKRKRIYDGDEARQLFEALYFTDPATTDTGTESESASETGLRLCLSSDSESNTSSDDDEHSLGHGQSASSTITNIVSQSEDVTDDNEVGLEVFNLKRQVKAGHSRFQLQTSEAELQSESDGEKRAVSEVDWNIDEELDGEERPVSEVDWHNDKESDGEKRAVLEVDWNNDEESDGEEGAVSEVVWHSDEESDGENRAVSEIEWKNEDVTRGRKRRRAHFIDSDSSVCSDGHIGSYMKGRKRNKESLELSAILRMKCCKKFCLHKVSRGEVFKFRTSFLAKSKSEQRQWLLQHLYEHHETSGSFITYMFNIGTTHLCQRGWRLALGIKRTRMWQVQRDFENGVRRYMAPNYHRIGMQSSKVLNSIAWLSDFSNRFGEKLPTCQKIHLPSCLTRESIYRLMKEEVENKCAEVCSKSRFFHVWRKEMSHISIPKVNRFSKCDICTTLKTNIEKTTDKVARQTLYQQREIHLEQQKNERHKYYKHIQKARREPTKYMSIIVDGMDQKATSIPRFYRQSKSTSSAWKLQSHITGALVHGRGTHLFVDLKEFPHDSNLTTNILLNILRKYDKTLPDVLYLQMDNCGRENKNQCVIALCALLVELNVFRKVKIGFLMKGHTHEDVDQLFSRVSVHTSKQNIPTLSSLMTNITQGYNKPNTTSERLTSIFNIRDWLQPNMHKVSHHSHPHQFRITKDENGKAVLHTKKWSNTSEWQCTTGENYIIKTHPEGVPHIVEPFTAELDLNNLRRDLPKYKPYLTQVEVTEWEELLSSLECSDDNNLNDTWMLLDILMGKDSQASIQQRPENGEENNVAFSNDEQAPIIPVNIGPKQRPERVPPQLRVDCMIGVYLREYRHEWPQVGKVTAIGQESITLHWFSGTATSAWTPLYRKARKGQEPYIQTIPSASTITHPFHLTGTDKLPQEVQRQLREKHEELYS
ncbi:uncharacterized protein LOC121425955 [Lytechinus variegatus]|uniref:uncharacterized protein LOC121425955 n=1 Tax=Lytechinus variegatus TaxID=7654 RepID=UPI001BB15FCC|nr:uncharacterized protein LOC121425955 [Lytechinus variegatus]